MIKRGSFSILACIILIVSTLIMPVSVAINTSVYSLKGQEFDLVYIQEECLSVTTSFVDDIIRFDDGIPYSGVGRTSGGMIEAAIRITPDELIDYNGWNLTGIIFYHNSEVTHSGLVKIYDGVSEQWPAELITQEPYTVTGTDWKIITLSTPVPLDLEGDVWVAVEITHEVGEIPLGIDQGPAVPHKGAYFTYPGISWYELPRAGIDSNWNLGGIVSNGKPAFKISNMRGVVGVSADIENIGIRDEEDIEWNIQISGGLLRRIDKTTQGLIPNFAVGDKVTIESDPIFGFGNVKISVNVHPVTSSVVSKNATGFLFGYFIFNIKE